jgi:hypothetical protein
LTDDRDQTTQNLKKAERMFQEIGMKYWLASTYVVYAEIFKRQGEKTRARDALDKAIEMFTECSAEGWGKQTGEKLAQL